MSWIAAVGWSAAGLLVALWLAVSFMVPSRRRELVEWTAATSMYLALLMLFTNLVLRARAADSTLGTLAFGFLWLVFAGGLLVAAVSTVRSLRGAGKSQPSATN